MAGVRVPGPGWTDARTTVVGVMGYPVRHSLSPILHNAAFAALQLNWVSVAFEVAGGRAAAALDGMRALGVAGLSVTMPHKADVAAGVDECSAVATQLRAVNCVLNRDGRLYGDNTDGAGFLASLARAAHFDPAGKQCLIIGAGGAARAVTLALADAGAASVTVVNRTAARAVDVAALAGPVGRVGATGAAALAADAALVVNATPVGMEGSGAAGDGWLIAPSLLHAGQVVADLVYAPRPTPWLAAAAEAGATTVDGLGMLVHQAAAQLELWTGLPAPVDVMWQAAVAGAGAGAGRLRL
jgi:shikimate dehydrogenase